MELILGMLLHDASCIKHYLLVLDSILLLLVNIPKCLLAAAGVMAHERAVLKMGSWVFVVAALVDRIVCVHFVTV